MVKSRTVEELSRCSQSRAVVSSVRSLNVRKSNVLQHDDLPYFLPFLFSAVGVHVPSLRVEGADYCVGKVRFGPYGCSAGLAVAADKAGARPSRDARMTALTMLTKSGIVCDSLVSSKAMRARVHCTSALPCRTVRPKNGTRLTLSTQPLTCRSRQSVRFGRNQRVFFSKYRSNEDYLLQQEDDDSRVVRQDKKHSIANDAMPFGDDNKVVPYVHSTHSTARWITCTALPLYC